MKKLVILALMLGVSRVYAGLEEQRWYPSGDGSFRVENGQMVIKSNKGPFYLKMPREEPKDNFVLSLKAKAISGDMLVFFADGGYRLTLQDGAKLERIKGMAYRGSGTLIAQNPYWKAEPEQWYKIGITKNDAYIRVEIDDKVVLSAADSWAWSGADIGLGVNGRGEAGFDNIEIISTEKKTRHGIDPRTNEDEIYTDKLTHEFITSKAVSNFSSSESYWSYYKNRVLWGSHHEDRKDWWEFYTSRHFYNPDTGKGLTISGINSDGISSLYKAKENLWPSIIEDYSKGIKWNAYYTLGRIAHLLEDTTSPAHCHLIKHFPQYLFGLEIPDWLRPWPIDVFEDWCPKQTSSDAYSATILSSHTSLDDFFKQTAYLAFGKATQDINGITASEVNSIVNMVYEASDSGNGKYKDQELLFSYVIPSDKLSTPDGQSGGLLGSYYNNKDLSGTPTLTRKDSQVYFFWDENPPPSPIDDDKFSVRWEGKIYVDKAQNYTFVTITDDGTRLWIDGNKVIDDWNSHSATKNEKTLYLSQGFHNIKMEYFEGGKEATCRLYWIGADETKRIEKLAKYIFPATIMKVGGLLKYFDQEKQNITIDPDYIIVKGNFSQLAIAAVNPNKKATYKLKLKNLGDPTNVDVKIEKLTYIKETPEGDKEFIINTETPAVSQLLNPGEEREVISIDFYVPEGSKKIIAYWRLQYAGKVFTGKHDDGVNETPIIIDAPSKIEITPDNFGQSIPIAIAIKSETGNPLENAVVTLTGYTSAKKATGPDGKAIFNIILDKQDYELGDITVWVDTDDVVGNYEDNKTISIKVLDKNPPKITYGPELKQLGGNSAVIYWETDVKTPTNIVEYGLSQSYGATAEGRAGTTSHTVYLQGLLGKTSYNYRVKSSDKFGNVGMSGNFTFTTLDYGTPPKLKILSPEEGAILSGMVTIFLQTFDYETLTLTLSLIDKDNRESSIGWGKVSPGTNTIEFPFDTENYNGKYILQVIANDTLCLYVEGDFAIATRTYTIRNWPS